MKLSWQIGQMIGILYGNINNDIPIEMPSHPYMLVNRSILCNCGIEVENHFLLKSFAACQDHKFKINYVLYSQYSFC